jgi:hypothetical protein
MEVLEVNPGFRVDQVLTMDVTLPWLNDPGQGGQALFFSALVDRLAQVGGAPGGATGACRWTADAPTGSSR